MKRFIMAGSFAAIIMIFVIYKGRPKSKADSAQTIEKAFNASTTKIENISAAKSDSSVSDSFVNKDRKNSEIESAEESGTEDDLTNKLNDDAEFNKYADISSIHCETNKCTVEAEAKTDDIASFQTAFLEFVKKHPEFGNRYLTDNTPDNPRNTTFVLIKAADPGPAVGSQTSAGKVPL